MCLVALALDQHRKFPLVIASNRDEFFARPATRLAWWTARPDGQPILSGRDIESGGTWLGLTAPGRLALLTNIRDPQRHDPAAPSRGNIVPDWLEATESIDRFWMRTALSGHNGFNLIAADFRQGECFWASNVGIFPVRLERGLYGLSNAALDSPWPKVQALKARMSRAMSTCDSVDALAAQLFDALADRSIAADATLPDTGLGLERERMLAPAFILTPDASYGTRCSTLVITERVNRNLVTHVLERSFGANGGPSLMRTATLRHWPPRHGSKAIQHADQGAVSESV
ncbi:NRDE family protein [soil metagenome]